MLPGSKLLRNKWIIVFFITLLVVSYYFLHTQYYYPEPNADAVKFFIKDKQRIPENNNSVYSIIGLNAPEDVKDIHTFGLNLVNETLKNNLDSEGKHLSLGFQLPKIDNEAVFNADAKKLYCWLNNNNEIDVDSSKTHNDECYTEDELRQVVIENNILLKRHEQLKKYTEYDDPALFARNGQLLINTHRLFLANIRLGLDQRNEESLKALIQDLVYHRELMSQPGTVIAKAIKLVLYGSSLEQLEYVITQHTTVALKYKEQIDEALSELTIEEFNLDGILREEFEIINSIYCIDERLGIDTPDFCQNETDLSSISVNYIINDFYKFYLDYKNMLGLDMQGMVEQCSAYSNKRSKNTYMGVLIHMPILSTYSSYGLIMEGMAKGCELMEIHKQKAAKHEELKLYLARRVQ